MDQVIKKIHDGMVIPHGSTTITSGGIFYAIIPAEPDILTKWREEVEAEANFWVKEAEAETRKSMKYHTVLAKRIFFTGMIIWGVTIAVMWR